MNFVEFDGKLVNFNYVNAVYVEKNEVKCSLENEVICEIYRTENQAWARYKEIKQLLLSTPHNQPDEAEIEKLLIRGPEVSE